MQVYVMKNLDESFSKVTVLLSDGAAMLGNRPSRKSKGSET